MRKTPMYVCVCNAITETDLHGAIADGHTTHEALQDELGVSTCCGTCRETVEEVLARRQPGHARSAGALAADTPACSEMPSPEAVLSIPA